MATDPTLDDGPSLLYHYTDTAGLLGILSTGTLWATDVFYLNDATELDYVYELFGEVLDDTPSGTSAGEVIEMLRVASRSARGLWRDVFHCFVACFCEEKDLLSQWRGYGHGVGGYSIGFKRSETESASTERNFGPYKFDRVEYDPIKTKLELTTQLNLAVQDYQSRTSQGVLSEDERLDPWRSLNSGYFSELGFNAAHYKSAAFAEEREWRIVSRLRRTDLMAKSLPRLRTTPLWPHSLR